MSVNASETNGPKPICSHAWPRAGHKCTAGSLHGESFDSNPPAKYPLKRGAGSCRLSRVMTVNKRRWSAGLNRGLPLIPSNPRSALRCAHGMRFAATHTLCTVKQGQRPSFLSCGVVVERFVHGQSEVALGLLECTHTPAAPMLCSNYTSSI